MEKSDISRHARVAIRCLGVSLRSFTTLILLESSKYFEPYVLMIKWFDYMK